MKRYEELYELIIKATAVAESLASSTEEITRGVVINRWDEVHNHLQEVKTEFRLAREAHKEIT